jgi:predicted secreted hydrolase
MKALKLFLPLILAPLLAAAGFYIWWLFSDRVKGAPADAAYIFGDGPPPGPAPGLDQATEGARQAFDFSRSHEEEPQEWWYFNAHLLDQKNRRYGLMFALLRTGQVLGSFTMVQHGRHYKMHQTGAVVLQPLLRLVTAPMSRFEQLDRWKFNYEFRLDHPMAEFTLRLKAAKFPLAVGGDGLIDMGDGGRSYYYSLTNMAVEGEGRIRGKDVELHGKGWMDHQWGDWNDREFDQWFWYSIQLADNTEILIFEFRRHSKARTPVCDVVAPDGQVRHGLPYVIRPLKNWVSPTTGRNWSVGWTVRIPDLDADLKITPDLEDQEVTKSLWEGVCKVDGRYAGRPAKGVAFYEARQRTW